MPLVNQYLCNFTLIWVFQCTLSARVCNFQQLGNDPFTVILLQYYYWHSLSRVVTTIHQTRTSKKYSTTDIFTTKLYHCAQKLILLVVAAVAQGCNCRDDTMVVVVGYPQPATVRPRLKTNNNTTDGIISNTMKQKWSTTINNVQFYWLRDRIKQGQFFTSSGILRQE